LLPPFLLAPPFFVLRFSALPLSKNYDTSLPLKATEEFLHGVTVLFPLAADLHDFDRSFYYAQWLAKVEAFGIKFSAQHKLTLSKTCFKLLFSDPSHPRKRLWYENRLHSLSQSLPSSHRLILLLLFSVRLAFLIRFLAEKKDLVGKLDLPWKPFYQLLKATLLAYRFF
jgi:hypothetical protein